MSTEAKTPARGGQDGVKTCTISSANLFTSLTDPENGVDLFTPPLTPKHAAVAVRNWYQGGVADGVSNF